MQIQRMRPGASASQRCASPLWRNVLSIVRKSRNSSGSLYRCRRRSPHYRRRTNAVRFLMRTLRAHPAPRLIHAFRQKPLWICSGCAAVFVLPAKPGLGHLGYCHAINRAHTPFGKSSILLFKPATTATRVSPKSLLAIVYTPSLSVLYPYTEQRQGQASSNHRVGLRSRLNLKARSRQRRPTRL